MPPGPGRILVANPRTPPETPGGAFGVVAEAPGAWGRSSMTPSPHESTGASPLVDRVRRAPSLVPLRAALARALERGDRVHLHGVRGSALAFVVAALREPLGRPVVVVCADDEAAADVAADLRTVIGRGVARFPAFDTLPHRAELVENLAVRGERHETLHRIDTGRAQVVVTSVVGLHERVVDRERFRAARVTLRAGDVVDLDALRARLVAMGYDAVPIVEEPGQFAVRGAIVDVYDPAWDHPVRIEFFDDEIESIRRFDVDSQRSVEAAESVTVLSIVPDADADADAVCADALAQALAARGLDADAIERAVDETVHVRSRVARRRYAPLLGAGASLLDYFDETPLVVVAGVDACERAWAREREAFENAPRPADTLAPLRFDDYVLAPDALPRPAAWLMVHALAPAAGDAPDEPLWPPVRDGERSVRLTMREHPSVTGSIDPLVRALRAFEREGTAAVVFSETPTQRDRIADLLGEDEFLADLVVGWMTEGFVWPDAKLAVLTDHQIFGRVLPRPGRRRARRRIASIRHDALTPGDTVVHVEYGIGRYVGLERVESDGRRTECLVLRYDGGDHIYVPLEQMHLVEKYVGREGVTPRLDRLGGTRWQKTREKARRAIEETARELLDLYARREVTRGHAFSPDTPWQRELEASFPFEETPHQLRAAREVKADMESPRPMDRLICGDVGFGKTEVAVRAAFKAVNDGKQVAVLVPTTLLAFQHHRTFTERMQRFPVRIAMLSRFVSPAEQKRVLEGLRDGSVDIVVGTHRLLSKDVKFRDLGLLVVDEEHRFGVKHKERLKQMTASVDVLSLTATPIPRTLHMALSGMRAISVIDTPPKGRHPVRTQVAPFDEEIIRRAIADELSRDGQVFFVHNRVRSIASMTAFLERLLPGVRFATAHGQMSENELERIVLDFVDRKYDVLVSTMIIESGLDYPNVNTIIVNRADRFGLAQLYQLRGRVGRRERQAYAYFLVPRQVSMTASAVKRLQAMEEFEDLGSGYRLAMRDLEIRGAGNVLGVEQHGHVSAVGFEMYCRMLKEAVEKLGGVETAAAPTCRVESPYDCFIPDETVADPDERMMIYRRLAGMSDPDDVEALAREMEDRFGRLDPATRNLLDLTWIKLVASRLGVVRVQIREPGHRARRPEALERAAEVPRRIEEAPRNVPHSRVGSSRLARLAARIEAGELGASAQVAVTTFEFARGRALEPAQIAKVAETFGRRVLFKSSGPFALELRGRDDVPALREVRNLLQVAYFSTRMPVSPGAGDAAGRA